MAEVDRILDGWFGESLEDAEDEDNRRRHLYEPLRKLFAGLNVELGETRLVLETTEANAARVIAELRAEIETLAASLAKAAEAKDLPTKIRDLEVVWSVGDFFGLADWATFEAGIDKGLEAAAKLIEKETA